MISAFARGLAGFGFAIAAVPILSLVISPIEAVAMTVMLQVVVGLKDIFDLRRDIHKPSLIRLALGSLIGTPIGVFALAVMNPDAARILIALSVFAGLLILLLYKPKEARPNDALATVTGVASGVFSGLSAMPGPPAVA
ncbi:sulfite exporter TauE/SafE family protein [Epibacterium ulvae]|uniref:sulfite exporter TauE/SafE family protein n=1 Tax=Epibacterium ulvae TaxID=1156985 RepID=UPI001BFBFBD9|nr:sulfite exporter TauE/SafE family protein [Epibacterium ulvae]MBT8153149.1 sulfite exporter TauE/SafE family protein [Epibacterium ulvae]